MEEGHVVDGTIATDFTKMKVRNPRADIVKRGGGGKGIMIL